MKNPYKTPSNQRIAELLYSVRTSREISKPIFTYFISADKHKTG